jgi:sugar phosphate permease
VDVKDRAAIRPAGPSYRFVILGTVWASYLIVYLSRLSVGPLAPFLKEAFDLSSAEVGSLMSATAVTYAPAMIAAGLLVDRVGVKRVLVPGTLVAGLCVGLLFVAPSYPVLLALLALSGIGCGCIYPSAVKALVTWFPPRERATAIGLNQSAINVSGIAGAALLPTVALTMGWQYGFLFVGLLAMAITVVCFVLYREPAGRPLRPGVVAYAGDARGDGGRAGRSGAAVAGAAGGAAVAGAAGTAPGESGWAGVLALLRRRDIWLLAAGGLFLGIVEFSALAHMVLFLNESLAYTAVAAGGLLALCEAAGAFGKPGSGLVSDRLFRGHRKPALLALAITAFGVCALFAVSGGDLGWLLYPCLAVFGVAAIGWAGLYGTLAGEIGGARRAGLAAGLCSAMVNVGIVVGPPVFGLLVDRTGSYRPSWVLMAVAAAIAVVCWSLLRAPAVATVAVGPATAGAVRAQPRPTARPGVAYDGA